MNKRHMIPAVLMAIAVSAAPALAQGNSGNAPGHGGDAPGNSGNAPGHGGGMRGGSSDAPGQARGGGFLFAPGQDVSARKAKSVDVETTASTGQLNFGTVISSIRAGKSDLSGLSDDATVNLVNVDDLIRGANRVALENAVGDNEAEIEALRDDLAALELEGLDEADIDSVVAARVEADGSLTLFTD